MERAHPPLRRVLRGPAAKVDPSLVPQNTMCTTEERGSETERKHERSEHRRVETRTSLSARNNPSRYEKNESGHIIVTCERDSCYSSCSEESHASLSRESSDALSSDMGLLKLSTESLSREALTPLADLPSDLVDFACNLGYSEAQLQEALRTVGANAGQDRILSELVKHGRCDLSLPARAPQGPSLRSIVIDGSNIAMTHGRKEVFSCSGIRECVKFFTDRGHTDVLVFIPQFRREACRSDCPITDQHILLELDGEKRIVWTPSRRIGGRRIVCHDDRYILKTADEKDGVIVSNDEYRDLIRENPHYKKLVENRLLMYSFVDGKFMPPDDPLGRHGPKLDQFLSMGTAPQTAQLCPYARKCTYGNKCRFFHPERPNGVHTGIAERMMKEKNHRVPRPGQLTTRPSMIYEQSPLALLQQQHQSVARTQSLNVRLEQQLANQENRPINQTNRLIPPSVSALPTWHNALSRNQSAPLGLPLRQQESPTSTSRSNSLLDMGGLYSATPPPSLSQSALSQSHMFTPSTHVWGQSEFSMGPLNNHSQMPLSERESSRVRLQYHLSHLFDAAAVAAVMAAHPEENDSQRLCEMILAFHKGFNS